MGYALTRSRMYRRIILALGLFSIACASHRQAPVRPDLIPYKPSGIYSVGEKAGWNVSLPGGVTAQKYAYTIKRNNLDVIASGDVDLSTGKAAIEITPTEPEMLYMTLTSPEGGRPQVFGAAVSPKSLKPVVPRPGDFDSFWRAKIAELEAIPENPVLTPGDSGDPDVDYATIEMDHVNGTHVYGQIAKPKRPGKFPALLIMQWASPPYPLQRPWVVDRAKEGWLALDIEPHDVLPTAPPSYYRALPAEIKNYSSIGQDDRDKSYFVEMYLRDYRALDYLSQRPDWDGKILVVNGTSMGGQQSLCVAGLHPKVTHLVVEVPSGCDLNAGLHARQQGYPNFPANDAKAMETARYVDAINFAPHIRAKCLVGMGFVDTVAPPCGIWTAFNLIRGPKEVAPMVDAPHNNTATRLQQKPFTDRANAWLSAIVKNERLDILRNVGTP
jgi:cephalosporin-C deacetylase